MRALSIAAILIGVTAACVTFLGFATPILEGPSPDHDNSANAVFGRGIGSGLVILFPALAAAALTAWMSRERSYSPVIAGAVVALLLTSLAWLGGH
jgi:hypothetical protein